MPDLYIANCTRQNHIVFFRLDFNAKGQHQEKMIPPTQRSIAPGQQVKVLREAHMDGIQSVTEQLGIYGLTAVADIPRSRNKFIPLVYNVDRPVTRKQMEEVVDHNNGVKVLEGVDRRKQAAVASNELVTSTVANELMRRGLPSEAIPENVETAVEFEQDAQSEAGERTIAEGIRVRPNAPGVPPTNKSGNRRGMRT